MKLLVSIIALTALNSASLGQIPDRSAPPAPLKGLTYDAPFFPGAAHEANVPTPDAVLGFRVGDKPAMHAEIERVIKSLAEHSPRVKLFEYAKSHEGRALYYLVIGSQANIERLDAIKAQGAKLADPRATAAAEADRLLEITPAIAWLGYVIHGDEMSGSDAALALAYHLAAGTDKDVTDLLENVLVIIDPLMNPDGRDRCILGVAQHRTVQPSVDDQTILHAQTWPSGRMNHYLFDLNRDWMFCTQPETRGRVKAVGEWNPHYFVESHEQGSLDTFLFMPPRAPVNPNIPASIRKWATIFAQDHARAFDAKSWRYYTGEWNEEWYPGYSGSWAALRGAIDNLYEQAAIVSDAVRRPEGTLEPYREAVHKQLVSSMANLQTLSAHRADVMRDFVASRRATIGDAGRAQRLFILTPPPGNAGRFLRLLDLLQTQGIEVFRAASEFTATGRDGLGRDFTNASFPAGTHLVPSAQPLGNLASALLEPDPRMPPEFLTEERRELLRFGRSRLYDITGWNIAMLFGVEVGEITSGLPAGATKVEASVASAGVTPDDDAVAWILPGEDDRSIAAAARLMERGVKLRVVDKPTSLDDVPVARGSIFITRKDNQDFTGELVAVLSEIAEQFGVRARPIVSGLGPGDNPDVGGQHFILLETPRIAVLTQEPFNPYAVGETWHLLDHEMGIRAAFLNTAQISGLDLRRYNVLILPDGGEEGWTSQVPAIKAWVEAGGTLIAIGGAAAPFCKEKDGIGTTRLLPDVLTKLDDYRAAIVRDWLGKTVAITPDEVWSHAVPAELEYPWTLGDDEKPEEDEAKRRDEWRELFMPQGCIVATRVDDRHWLTAGCAQVLPVLMNSGPVLIPELGGNAPLLFGEFTPVSAENSPSTEKQKKKKPAEAKAGADPDGDAEKDEDESPPPGWLVAPPGYELRLRMSGLLWPEAAARIAHAAYVTQERIGNGQIILFAASPTYRAAARGSTRILMNAVVCGPGMGASHPIIP